jgi:hypothetical protein
VCGWQIRFFDTFETAKAFSLECILKQAGNPASAAGKGMGKAVAKK